jgi:hypothetical protein
MQFHIQNSQTMYEWMLYGCENGALDVKSQEAQYRLSRSDLYDGQASLTAQEERRQKSSKNYLTLLSTT